MAPRKKTSFEEEDSVNVVTEPKVTTPPLYAVFLHNDDYTSMEFVVSILRTVFFKTEQAAVQIMLTVHKTGLGCCGVYSKEVAEAKVGLVQARARQAKFPLRCTMEKA